MCPFGMFLQVRVDADGIDAEKWKIDFVWWRGKEFRSIDRFIEAHDHKEVSCWLRGKGVSLYIYDSVH